jgi:hypothetical protein
MGVESREIQLLQRFQYDEADTLSASLPKVVYSPGELAGR